MNKKLEKKIKSNINKLNLKCERLKYLNKSVFRELYNIKLIIKLNRSDTNDLYKKIRITNYSIIMLSIAFLFHILSHLLG